MPSLRVWPNPAADAANVQLTNLGDQPATLRLYDLSGHLAGEMTIVPQQGAWEGRLPVHELPNGIYLLRAGNARGVQTLKLVVSH